MTRLTAVITTLAALNAIQSASGQSFDDDLIDRARTASRMIPGDLPLDVRFEGIVHWEEPLSVWVQHAPSDMHPAVIGVFQIRFPDGWIIVDAGGDKEILFDEFSDESYARVGEALRKANLIVITHEHHDHVAGLVRGPWAEEVRGSAMLTKEQLQTLITKPNDPKIQITQEDADQFLSVQYDELLPIAPGVVLIKAPGHTPGSQIVFVRQDSGTEMILIGDLVWMTAAFELGSQKPLKISMELGEDRDALATQLTWLRNVIQTTTHVVVAHDALALDAQMQAGVIKNGLYLGRSE